jgi:ABC-type sugar transport system substrate-binding protein
MVAKYEKGTGPYPFPTKSFNPGTGKAAVMACGFAAAVCATQAKLAVKAFQAMGWTSSPAVDGQFSPQVQAGFLDRAVQQHLDAVIMVSVDVSTIKSSFDRAVKAGLLIGCSMCNSAPGAKAVTKTTAPDLYGKVFDTVVDWTLQGQLEGWQILARQGDNAKVVSFSDKAFTPPPQRRDGLTQLIAKECPKCPPVEAKEFATADIAKPGPPEFTALLSTKPSGTITDVVAHYDGLGTAMAKTAKARGRTDATVSGYDGSEDGITALSTGNPPYGASVAEPYTFAEWAAVDLIGRAHAKQPLWDGYTNLPSTLITKDNASQFLNPWHDPTPPGDWQGKFKALWGK